MSDTKEPCRFCGNDDQNKFSVDKVWSNTFVRCWTCNATGPWKYEGDDDGAVAAWNRRSSPAQATDGEAVKATLSDPLRTCVPFPESMAKSYCPKHARLKENQTGFRCCCAEMEVAWICGQTELKAAQSSPDGVVIPDGAKDRLAWALGEVDAPGNVPYRIKMALQIIGSEVSRLQSAPSSEESAAVEAVVEAAKQVQQSRKCSMIPRHRRELNAALDRLAKIRAPK